MRRAQQSGFTLIEVLVSALVLSIGLLGVAGLQALSLQNNQGAFMRSQASVLAYDLADRMRANIGGTNANFYVPASRAVTETCKTTTGCTAQQMAHHDLAEWYASIAAFLPAGEGFVCIDSTPDDGAGFAAPACDGVGSQFSIKLWWDDDRDGVIDVTPPNVERFAINVQL